MTELKPAPTPAMIGDELTKIMNCYAHFALEAVYRADDREMPGGEAMQALAPAARLEEWEEQFEAAEHRAFAMEANPGHAREVADMLAYVFDQYDTDTQPELVLTDWEAQIRAERGADVNLRSDVHKATRYLRSCIPWMFSLDEDGQPVFFETRALHADLKTVRSHLENIVRSGTRAQFTRVRCIAEKCDSNPRLMKLFGARVAWDRYRCPACRTEYDAAMFRMARAQNLHSRGAAQFIPPRDAADATEVPVKTVYTWMSRRKAERVWVTPAVGRPWAEVWWPDVRDLAIERAARLKRAAIARATRRAEAEAKAAAEEAAAEKTRRDTEARRRSAS